MRACVLAVSLLTGVGVMCGAASGQVLIDNLAEPRRDATILGTVEPDNVWAAQSFSTPNAARLVSIETYLGFVVDAPDAFIELRSGEDPSGVALATFAVPALSDVSLDVVTLTPDVSVTLEPGTLYWLVMGTVSAGSFQWSYAEGNAFSGPGAFGSYFYSFDQGVTWINFGGDNPYHLRVNVEDVPAYAADFNGDGAVNSQDFFDFVTAFFALEAPADFNVDGFVNSQDFFDFVSVFFAGC